MSEGNFEAVKYALRQSKDGVIIQFVVHPSDVSPELMALPIGSRVMIGWAEIGENEQNGAARLSTTVQGQGEPASDPGFAGRPASPKPERKLSQQCGAVCADKRFEEYVRTVHAETGRIDDFVRIYCKVNSRAELDFDEISAARWRDLHSRFQQYLTDKNYSEAAR